MSSIAQPVHNSPSEKFNSLRLEIGNTPMVEILYAFRGQRRSIFAKCENYNLTGSIKDRMALHILEQAYLERKIKKGDTIIEATSGNTGISLAAIGTRLGHPVKIIMPNWLSRERKEIIKFFGAEVIEVSLEEGGFLRSIAMAEEAALSKKNTFLPRQFSNPHNADAHRTTTAREIWHQLLLAKRRPDAFVAGVGTGGTIMGISNHFKSLDKSITVHPLEPAESPTLSTGYKTGKHRIQGVSDEFIPSIVDFSRLDQIIQVHDGDAILMAKKIATLGLGVGISSGANILGAIKVQDLVGSKATVVTVFPDCNKKYLSTDLTGFEPKRENYLTPEIVLLGCNTFRRSTNSVL